MRKFILSSVMLAAMSIYAPDACAKPSFDAFKAGAHNARVKAQENIVNYVTRAKKFFAENLKGKEKTAVVKSLEDIKKGLASEDKLRSAMLNEFIKMFKVFEDAKVKETKIVQVRVALINQFGPWATQLAGLPDCIARETIYNILLIVRSTLKALSPEKVADESQLDQIKRQSAKAIITALDKSFPDVVALAEEAGSADAAEGADVAQDDDQGNSDSVKKHHKKHHHRHHHNKSVDEDDAEAPAPQADAEVLAADAPSSEADEEISAPDAEEEVPANVVDEDSPIPSNAREHKKLSKIDSAPVITPKRDRKPLSRANSSNF